MKIFAFFTQTFTLKQDINVKFIIDSVNGYSYKTYGIQFCCIGYLQTTRDFAVDNVIFARWR